MKQFLFTGNATEHLSSFLSNGNFSQYLILMDENTQQFCLPLLQQAVPELATAARISVYAGEEHKNLQAAEYIWQRLTEQEADRKALLINLGGGMITDLGGFAASVYKRGIRFIHIPTTLLAQADAAIGGKNGIDYLGYKNQIGVFRQPSAIFFQSEFLKTLPEAQLTSGFAEVVKHALIAGGKFWKQIAALASLEDVAWNEMISESIAVKLAVVEEDPGEKHVRKVLNFGHTVGHAIESLLMSRKLETFHGHCIAAGMVAELMLSVSCCGLKEERKAQAVACIERHFPKIALKESDVDPIMDFMRQDKKNESGFIQMVLLRKIGRPQIDVRVDEADIRKVLGAMIAPEAS